MGDVGTSKAADVNVLFFQHSFSIGLCTAMYTIFSSFSSVRGSITGDYFSVDSYFVEF